MRIGGEDGKQTFSGMGKFRIKLSGNVKTTISARLCIVMISVGFNVFHSLKYSEEQFIFYIDLIILIHSLAISAF